jgi:hypothetical protein
VQLDQLKASLGEPAPPPELAPALRALWLEARGDWDAAHDLANEAGGRDGAWVHAYLHRKEGDLENAAYWYRRAGRTPHEGTLELEWEEIAAALLAR